MSTLNPKTKLYKRDYSKFSEQSFIEDVKLIQWEHVLPSNDNVNEHFDAFYSKMSSVISKHVPLKKYSRKEIKNMSKPWITSGIKASIKVKNNYFKKYLDSHCLYYQSLYKSYRNKLTVLIKASKVAYYKEYFASNSNNIKNVWKGIKQIVTLKPSKLNIPNKIVKNGTEITNTMDIVNAFNDYFSKIGSNLAKLIEKSDISPLRYLKNPTPHSLFLLPVTSLEIEEEIMNLNTNRATGPIVFL